MHDQSGNFSRGSETVRINANARKKKPHTITMTGTKKNIFDGLISRRDTNEKMNQ